MARTIRPPPAPTRKHPAPAAERSSPSSARRVTHWCIRPTCSMRRTRASPWIAKGMPILRGRRLIYSTYLGGTLDESVNAIAVDQTGNAYIAGETYSSNFPVKNAFQPVKPGYLLINASLGSGFVAKLNPGGNALVYSSFLG